jgi:hypothetical protein
MVDMVSVTLRCKRSGSVGTFTVKRDLGPFHVIGIRSSGGMTTSEHSTDSVRMQPYTVDLGVGGGNQMRWSHHN